ncbi:T-lymphocyte activation antigen CD86 isoform X4 [Saccopteryx bilineata]|uniref:T-lymphocyte activation antigen CD86 isoform X4 n=1 Tax=Saccopteryx bilineata TaxID=59482 RepID=UPI00338F6BA4
MDICDSTMGLKTVIFVVAFLYSDAAFVKNQAYFNKTGQLPCNFINSENISTEELVVFWQNQKKLVLYELYKGKEKPTNIDSSYKGRTSLGQDKWTLQLHNVQVKDEGLYYCYIHRLKSQGMVPVHQKSIDLSVLANFSQPEIMPISNRTENSDINLTCSSVQGYPKPEKMFFLLTTVNSTEKYDADMREDHSNITGLYNVSISLPFSVTPETNVSIFCVLQPGPTQEQLLSRPYNIDAKLPVQPPPPPESYASIVAVAILGLLTTVCVIVASVKYKKRKKQQAGSSHESEGTRVEGEESQQAEGEESQQAEGEESQQAKERVENSVPERSDEAQCVVNISKTASEHTDWLLDHV